MLLRAVGDKVIHSSCLRIINKMWNYRINEKKKKSLSRSQVLNNAARSVADVPQL